LYGANLVAQCDATIAAMSLVGDFFSSITFWETATIDATLFAAVLQSISAILSWIEYFRKKRHPNQNLVMFRLSWKWRKRSSVKIAERTYEKRTEALHC
jgi:hypothetical protein